MTRDEVIAEIKVRVRKQFIIPRGLEGTTQGNLIVLDNMKNENIKPFVYKNSNELLSLCTDYYGDVFLARMDREVAATYREEVNKFMEYLGKPLVEF